MYTTIIHPLRSHLHLSILEYCVLDSIYHLQNKEKYDFWCVGSQSRIAEVLGVTRETVNRCYKTLLERGYIKEGGVYQNKTKKVRVVEEVCDLFNHHKQVKAIAYEDEVSITPPKQQDEKNISYDKMSQGVLENVTGGCEKMSHNIYNNINSNNKITSKEVIVNKGSQGSFGKEEINKILEGLQKVIGCEDFRESAKQQRVWGNNLYRLKEKIGSDEFKRRLVDILSDEFKKKNASSLQYLYKEIKSFISN